MAQKTIKTRISQKHDLEVNWLKATGFVPMQGELIIYDIEIDAEGNTLTDESGKPLLPESRQEPYTHERLKIGDGIRTVANLPFTTGVDNNSLTRDNYGIVRLNQEYINYLDAQIYEYPSITEFNIVESNQEVGTTVTLSSFTHKEQNSKNIDGNLTLTSNKTDINQTVAPSDSGATVSISDTYKFTTNTTLTYTLKGTDTRGNSITKTDNISSYYPSFVGASSSGSVTSDEISTSFIKVASSSLSGTRSIASSNQYVYFISTTAIKSIKSGGFEVSYTSLDNVTLNINGVEKSYYIYRTNETISETLNYVIS